jgi:hypothetical protein
MNNENTSQAELADAWDLGEQHPSSIHPNAHYPHNECSPFVSAALTAAFDAGCQAEESYLNIWGQFNPSGHRMNPYRFPPQPLAPKATAVSNGGHTLSPEQATARDRTKKIEALQEAATVIGARVFNDIADSYYGGMDRARQIVLSLIDVYRLPQDGPEFVAVATVNEGQHRMLGWLDRYTDDLPLGANAAFVQALGAMEDAHTEQLRIAKRDAWEAAHTSIGSRNATEGTKPRAGLEELDAAIASLTPHTIYLPKKLGEDATAKATENHTTLSRVVESKLEEYVKEDDA